MPLNMVFALLVGFLICERLVLRRHSPHSWRTWLLIVLIALTVATGYLVLHSLSLL